MSKKKQSKTERLLPIEDKVPTTAQLLKALRGQCYSYKSDRIFVRAVANPKYVATASPFVPGRFGPSPETAGPDLRLPFTWLYLAVDSLVAAWEGQLVRNNHGPGTGFHITLRAEEEGRLAFIKFPRPLGLWRLDEDHSSRLGIHDMINDGEYAACNLLGERLREAILMMPAAERPDGFVYPSRRVKGAPALALADWAAKELFENAEVDIVRFVESEIYARFCDDVMRTDPPELDAS
ncbi:RES domain-containing protein [Caballeronia sp. LZ035]|uniref:RES domain-containing protein n=1 Tax=Caballeronia sp. LZ035 TaxID=3038568 RepID=UPI00285AEDF5|nr:RES domain-containing protein [Caballeronia sp. LZ035]MDR5763441.1 RES domain-containing protein [Caballeronia sp. LZ035]